MSANTNSIQQLYVAYFGRPADKTGLAYWETQVALAGGLQRPSGARAPPCADGDGSGPDLLRSRGRGERQLGPVHDDAVPGFSDGSRDQGKHPGQIAAAEGQQRQSTEPRVGGFSHEDHHCSFPPPGAVCAQP